MTFSSDCSTTPAGPLCGYETAPADIDDEEFTITAALYEGGTSATGLVNTVASGPNGTTHNIDEVEPAVVDLFLADQVNDWLDGIACCAHNWVGEEYAFADGLDADPTDDGVGIDETMFYWAIRRTTTRTSQRARRWRRRATRVWT